MKGTFANETSLPKVLFLRTIELHEKWENGHPHNWALILNQLRMHDRFAQARPFTEKGYHATPHYQVIANFLLKC